jgi:hypothetical protein
VPVRWLCRTGVCYNCETGLISGSVIYRSDPVEPPAAGNLLIWCSQPKVTLLSIFDAVEAAPRAGQYIKRYKQPVIIMTPPTAAIGNAVGSPRRRACRVQG